MDWFEQLEADGFSILRRILARAEVEAVIAASAKALASADDDGSVFGRGGSPHGAQNLLRLWPAAVDLVRTPVLADMVWRVLGPDAGVVRGLYFDKPPGMAGRCRGTATRPSQ